MASFQQEKDLDKLKKMCYSKVAHKSMLSAEYALDQMVRLPNSARLTTYICPICGDIHIGKTNKFLSKILQDASNKQSVFHHNSRDVDTTNSSSDTVEE